MTRLLIFDKKFFPKSWASKLGVWLLCECGLYAGVYGNRKVIGRLRSHNDGFGSVELESEKMADSRFETLNEEKFAELLNDKDI